MKVLFCGLKYEYGKPEAGPSFEYQNFYEVLRRMEGVECDLFAIDEKTLEVGRDVLNAQLIYEVEEKRYDLLFCFLFTEEIKKSTIEYITKKTKTKTFNWFADDHWRFFVYSRYWAPLFTLVSTTDSKAPARYKRYGISHVLKTQWAANHFLYKPVQAAGNYGQEYDYNITFVGKNYGNRGKYIQNLKDYQLSAVGFGSGWEGGRVSFEEMLNIFSFSKINLNFTKMPYVTLKERLKLLAKLVVKKEFGNYKLNLRHFYSNFLSAINSQHNMIKGRTFEIPACGGFQITEDADNLVDYYKPGKEIVIFRNADDLAEKCRYYLDNEDERWKIAKAGFERTLREHTYEHRFREIFNALEL